MSKHAKTLSRLCTKPAPSDIKWSELKALMLHLGFKEVNNNGSRRKFIFEDDERRLIFSCHEPHKPACVDKGCVSDAAAFLDENGFT